jgi:predicted PurR-regulated permease PerM
MDALREDRSAGRGRDRLARRALMVSAIALGLAAGLFLVWAASDALFVVFAGLLVAVAFDAAAAALGRLVGWHRRWRLLAVVILFSGLILALLALGGATLVQQFGQLAGVVEAQIERLIGALGSLGIELQREEEGMTVEELFGALRSAFGGVAQVATFLLGGVTGAALIVFLGVFFAWEPRLYRSSAISLVPADRRARLAEVLDRARGNLAWWIAGQGISMLAIFVLTFALLSLVGMPLALLLAVLAGLLAFIPIIGAVIAGIVIVVVGLAQSPLLALYGLGVYLLIQFVESNLLAPVVQERTVRLPPAFTLSFQLVFAVLFGFLGLALAVPIAAAGKVFVEELYVKDRLGGFWEE